MSDKDLISVIAKIASSTMSFDLNEVKPMNSIVDDETISNIGSQNDDTSNKMGDGVENDETVSEDELSKIKEILKKDISGCHITKIDDNRFIVRSPSITWKCLCGREYLVDLDKHTSKLTALS